MATFATARLEARLPNETHALLKRAAELQGRSLSDFVVAAASEAAVRVVEQQQLVRLSIEDQKRFAAALLDPPTLAPALEQARHRHQALIQGT